MPTQYAKVQIVDACHFDSILIGGTYIGSLVRIQILLIDNFNNEKNLSIYKYYVQPEARIKYSYAAEIYKQDIRLDISGISSWSDIALDI